MGGLSCDDGHFYPRSPCGERRVTVLGIQHRVGISIHALLAESDLAYPDMIICTNVISIHALLAESDVGTSQVFQRIAISIHALLAESDSLILIIGFLGKVFLSTLSLRRAT